METPAAAEPRFDPKAPYYKALPEGARLLVTPGETITYQTAAGEVINEFVKLGWQAPTRITLADLSEAQNTAAGASDSGLPS